MKPELRREFAELPFEEKIRKVGELIRLARKLDGARAKNATTGYPECATRKRDRSTQRRSKNNV
jgi:hypothetical protein